MGLRTQVREALREARRAAGGGGDSTRAALLRLVNAALDDRESALRATGNWGAELPEEEIAALFARMVRQREDSARAYEEAGHLELAAKEMAEISILNEYRPRVLDSGEMALAVDRVIALRGAEGVRDLAGVMADLRRDYAGQMDFEAAGALVRARLL